MKITFVLFVVTVLAFLTSCNNNSNIEDYTHYEYSCESIFNVIITDSIYPIEPTSPIIPPVLPIIDEEVTVNLFNRARTPIATGSNTFIIKDDGNLWGWGSNRHGQLGDGTTEDRNSPIKIMENVIAISAGGSFTMAIRNDGSLWAWGNNNRGQLGDGTTITRHSPVLIKNNVIAVSAGSLHTMAILYDKTLWVWGCNEWGKLG
ncbi:MAG: hypothetical protein FWC16_07785 [Defluviitaleaceae bacterium]|nr:hypothetical protein [Defluviitaleaceae bacterium]MCL2274815.1 hypothetical protein [Defluviitaleaceae bacterium]